MLLAEKQENSMSLSLGGTSEPSDQTPSDCFIIVSTPIGSMVAVANDSFLLALYFIDEDRQDEWIEQLSTTAVQRLNVVLELLQQELQDYFNGTLKVFTVSIGNVAKTKFFADVLQCVKAVPYGVTKSYGQIAQEVGNVGAVRAVGAANKSNVLLLVIPCHRVVRGDGSLGGYSQGIDRKAWLLHHEQSFLDT